MYKQMFLLKQSFFIKKRHLEEMGFYEEDYDIILLLLVASGVTNLLL